jgi:hypothetical protein
MGGRPSRRMVGPVLCVPLYRVAPGAGNTHFATAFLTGHSFGTVGAYANPHRHIVSITNRGPCEREGVHSLTGEDIRGLTQEQIEALRGY